MNTITQDLLTRVLASLKHLKHLHTLHGPCDDSPSGDRAPTCPHAAVIVELENLLFTEQSATTERDDWKLQCGVAEQDAADLRAEVVKLTRALGNCYMMACRRGRGVATPENADWQHIKRFCEETGMKPQILRATLPTELTDGEEPHETPQCNAMMERQDVEGNYARGPWMTLAHKIEKQFMEARAELATPRATRDADHGAAIEAAAKACWQEMYAKTRFPIRTITTHMRGLVATVTNSQQKGGEEPCAANAPAISERTQTVLSMDAQPVASNAAPTSDPEGAATPLQKALALLQSQHSLLVSAHTHIDWSHNDAIMKELEEAIARAATPLPSVTETAKEILASLQIEMHEPIEHRIESILSRFLGARENELRELRAECERLRKDKERLEWVMEFITQNGGDGIAKLIWSQVDPEEIMEDRIDLTFDRVAIDAAMQPSETRERP